ncbi:MAG: PD-(D/E)XK nuclease family protein [Cyclobacteriaceae bacterium]|nr:PD-(D/E)XK nuclease family protein [Cyclobacteriaceae bacterium]
MTEQIINLILFTSTLRKQYDKISQATGENFNVFRILNLATNETRTHSAFLAELLSPKGSHGQGSIFLKLFIEQLGIETFDYQSAVVEIEKFAGYVDADYLEGGRIDIAIYDKNGWGIIIENKIYAGDQKNQLLRYHKYGKANFKNGFDLIYLTLYGNDPSAWSLGDEQSIANLNSEINLQSISYRDDVINWLELAKKEAANHPLLRETITQYINLLKELTGQTMNNQLTTEITEKVIKGGEESIKALFEIRNSIYPHLIKTLIEKLIIQVKDLGTSISLETSIDENLGANNTGFYFYNKDWAEINIGFAFENGRLYYGICRAKWDTGVSSELQISIQQRLGVASKSNHWPWWQWYYQNESNDQTYIDIQNGTLIQKVHSIVLDLQDKLKGLTL